MQTNLLGTKVQFHPPGHPSMRTPDGRKPSPLLRLAGKFGVIRTVFIGSGNSARYTIDILGVLVDVDAHCFAIDRIANAREVGAA